MNPERDGFLRKALWTTAAFNTGAAAMVAFPYTAGGVLGLPTPVPRVYTTLLAVFIFLFGAMYAWLAASREIDRLFIAFAAVGKASVFVVFFAFWLAGNATLPVLAAATGDLAFAAIFVHWFVSRGTAR